MINSHKIQYSYLISCKSAIRLHYSSFRAATLMLCYTEWATAQTAVNENVHRPSPPDTVTKHTVSKNEHKYSRHEYRNEWKDNWVDKSFMISAPCVSSWSNLSEWVKLSGYNLLDSHEQDFYQLAGRQTGLLCNASNEISSLDPNLTTNTALTISSDFIVAYYWTSGGVGKRRVKAESWLRCPIHIRSDRGSF